MSAPESVVALARHRMVARVVKDFALADTLREEIAKSGYEVVDVEESFELIPKAVFITLAYARDIRPIDLDKETTVAIIVEGFTTLAQLNIESLKANSDCGVVILSIGNPGEFVQSMDSRTYLFAVAPGAGWGDCANALLEKVKSTYLILMQPSTHISGNAVNLAVAELKRGEFVAVGSRGGLINIEDEWRSVNEKSDGEVDVLYSDFLALNRDAARESGGFNPRAMYYENADIEFSLRVRQAGGRLLQMALPVDSAPHIYNLDGQEDYRQLQSTKNYGRILERFKGKSAILSPRR